MVASKKSGHCTPAMLMALMALMVTAAGQGFRYEERDVTNCDGDGFAYIATAEECEAAAGQVGYDDSSATRVDTSRGDVPRGCYGVTRATRANLVFNSNTGGTSSSSSSARASICRVVGMCGSPHVLCPQGMPDLFQPCPIGGRAPHPG